MKEAIENVWIANIITGGGLLAVIVWFAKRLIKSIDERFDKQDKRITSTEEEAKEIKKNYITRFEGVHEKIDETKGVLVEEIQKIQHDKHQYRERQAAEMATLKVTLDGAVGFFKEIWEDIRQMRNETRH